MNIESYTKGNSSLEEKENTINELVNCLDEQSFDFFFFLLVVSLLLQADSSIVAAINIDNTFFILQPPCI